MPKIIIDSREQNHDLINAIGLQGIEIERETLPVGDYLISDRVCIERKTISDFEGCIVSGRLFEQIKRLTDAYSSPIILIEGSRDEFRMKSAVINGTIASLYINYKVQSIVTFGLQETAEIIRYLAKHEQEKQMRSPSVKGGPRAFTQNQFMEKIIGNVPGVGIETARSLLRHFGSVRAIACADEKQLKDVKNIGKKRAIAIMKIMSDDYVSGDLDENGNMQDAVADESEDLTVES